MKAQIVSANAIIDDLSLESDPSHRAVFTTFPSLDFSIIYDCVKDDIEIFVGLSMSQGYSWDPNEVKEIEVPDSAAQQALDLTKEWKSSFKEMWVGFLKKEGYLK